MKKEKTKKVNAIKNLFYMIKMIWEISPSRVILEVASSLVNFGVWLFYSVIFWKYLFGSANELSFKEAVVFIIVVFICDEILNVVLAWFYTVILPTSDIDIHRELNKKLFKKATNVDLACYETPEFYEKYTRATAEAFTRGISAVTNFSNLIGSAIFAVVGLVMVLDITVWCLPFLIMPIIGHVVISPTSHKHSLKLSNTVTEYKRAYDYVNRTVYLQKYAGEMRMTGIFGVMRRTYERTFKKIYAEIKKYALVLTWYHWLGCIFAYVLSFFGMWVLASYLALDSKTIALTEFIVLSSAIATTSNMVGDLGQNIRNIAGDAVFVENLKEFLAYTPDIPEDQDGIGVKLPVDTVEFKNVGFKYKGSDKWVLKDINVTLKSGEKVTIVGINGSGKSTFVKLLMRLYDPTEGEILLNGINIKEYNLREYRMLIGATFQDFALFAASVAENVMLDEIKDDAVHEAAVAALKESGVYDRITRLENDADTILTREFDDNGVVLSGGEGQKVAIARAFAKKSPIVILDEPSSALDPIAEFNMYETIMRLCSQCDPDKGKIAIIISHRLSATALSDKIMVLDGGRLVQFGTHAQLMSAGGAYSDMFLKQAESYLTCESEVAQDG